MPAARYRLPLLLAGLATIMLWIGYSHRFELQDWLRMRAQTQTQTPPPPAPFADAPGPLRDFLRRAKAADAIVDPYARCLAFPDLPGNRWPPGLARAMCEAWAPAIGKAYVEERLERGDVADIERRYLEDAARHFDRVSPSESIHADFRFLRPDVDSEKLTRRWLELAPRSAVALTARASYFRRMAWAARGEKYVSETPPDDLRSMSTFVARAIEYYQAAIAVDPRFMPAYAGLLDAAILDGREGLATETFRRGAAIDPYCVSLATNWMSSLEPKWGGSLDAMAAYGPQLRPGVAVRPRLANIVAAPEAYAASEALSSGNDALAMDAARRASVVAADAKNLAVFADASLHRRARDHWLRLVYLLEYSRFHAPESWHLQQLGRQLSLEAGDPGWAIVVLSRGVARDSDDLYARMELADAYAILHRDADAKRERNLVAEDPALRSNLH